jgi:K+-sensing histidine kinase KdpD
LAVSNLYYQRIGASFFSYSLLMQMAGLTLITAYLLLFPISFAIAILRYRLWDIDILIRRTLAYSLLTALLALIYIGSVLLLQNVFNSLTGENQPETVTILSTLAIAALFSPLRRRVQNGIDRRFYRQKYDMEKTLAVFSGSLRDEVELDTFNTRLLAVVESTMQPECVLLWVRPAKKAPAVETFLPRDDD